MTFQTKTYETTELKLAALLLTEIPNSFFKISQYGNAIKKIIQVSYPDQHEEELNKLIREYIERKARVDVYKYNHTLNMLRNKLRDG